MKKLFYLWRRFWNRLLGREDHEFGTWILILRGENNHAIVVGEMDGTRQQAEDSAAEAIVNYWWKRGELTKPKSSEYMILSAEEYKGLKEFKEKAGEQQV